MTGLLALLGVILIAAGTSVIVIVLRAPLEPEKDTIPVLPLSQEKERPAWDEGVSQLRPLSEGEVVLVYRTSPTTPLAMIDPAAADPDYQYVISLEDFELGRVQRHTGYGDAYRVMILRDGRELYVDHPRRWLRLPHEPAPTSSFRSRA